MKHFKFAFIGLEVLVSGVLLFLAWTLPLMSVKSWVFFEEKVSLFSVTARLYDDGLGLLAFVVFFFAIVFPAVKFLVLSSVWFNSWSDETSDRFNRRLDLFDLLGKWSMLDVFIVAVVIVGFQSSLVSEASLHPGLYCFAGSILLSMVALTDLKRYRARSRAEAEAALGEPAE